MLVSASGCDKKGAAGTNEPSPVDDAAKIVIDFLQAGDYDAMMKVAESARAMITSHSGLSQPCEAPTAATIRPNSL